MTDPEDQPAILRVAMRSWRRRSNAVADERDSLVLACLDAQIPKEEIHRAMGLGRNTIDRIQQRAQEEGLTQ